MFVRLQTKQEVEVIEGGVLTAAEIGVPTGTVQPLPTRLSLDGLIKVERCRHSAIRALQVRKIKGEPLGWRASFRIEVEELRKVQFTGSWLMNLRTISPIL